MKNRRFQFSNQLNSLVRMKTCQNIDLVKWVTEKDREKVNEFMYSVYPSDFHVQAKQGANWTHTGKAFSGPRPGENKEHEQDNRSVSYSFSLIPSHLMEVTGKESRVAFTGCSTRGDFCCNLVTLTGMPHLYSLH